LSKRYKKIKISQKEIESYGNREQFEREEIPLQPQSKCITERVNQPFYTLDDERWMKLST